MLGREARTGSVTKGNGYLLIHSTVHVYSRLAYSEILSADNRDDCVAFSAGHTPGSPPAACPSMHS